MGWVCGVWLCLVVAAEAFWANGPLKGLLLFYGYILSNILNINFIYFLIIMYYQINRAYFSAKRKIFITVLLV